MANLSKAKREAVYELLRAGLKSCCRCHETKPISEFSSQPKDRTGLRPECRQCVSESHRVRYVRDREKVLARTREYSKTEHRRRWNRDYQRNRCRRVREALADRPRPVACEACGCAGPVFYDHDHKTGKRIGRFRGWLCNGCNSALGYAKNDASVLRGLADYLDRDAAKEQGL